MNVLKISVILAFFPVLVLTSCQKDEKVIKTDAISFEEIKLDEKGYFNGSDGSGGFYSGNAFFKTNYNAEYQSWSGFAVSSLTDTLDPGYTNQYSTIAGPSNSASKQFAILYSYSSDTIEFEIPAKITNIALSNSTYAYYSMKNGNDFCKKFGGASGNDPDFFYLNLSAIDSKGNKINFNPPIPLADFTFDDNSKDYILKNWEYINLSSAGYIKYLIFNFSSSDTSIYGINTPTYVCIDNIVDEWEE
jgi:hypothetical protein